MPEPENKSTPLIGHSLIDHARKHGKPTRLPLTTQLFPYILIASRRMPSREISEWLETEMGVTLSAPMIVKGLKSPHLHLKRLAEHIQPLVAYLSALSRHSVADLLFHYDLSGKTVFQIFKEEEAAFGNRSLSPDAVEAMEAFSETWDTIPDEVKYMCRPYFDDTVVLHRVKERNTPAGGSDNEACDENSELNPTPPNNRK